MARRVLGPMALLLAVTSLSPAHSATLMNNAIRISPTIQFHSVSPNVQFSERHSLSDIRVTKHIDVATPKSLTRKRSLSEIPVTKHIDKATSKLITATPPPPPEPLPIPYPNMGAQQ
jgi:hypothetical protein